MIKIACGVSYVGTNFHGWQKQKEKLKTIAGELTIAINKIAATDNIELVCAGRTDAGVHACEQVIHFECNKQRPLKAWVLGVNSLINSNIAINWSTEVNQKFNARFSATARSYIYVIYNDHIFSPIFHNRVAMYPQKLNIKKMQQAAQYLLGEHDFSAFRASGCQAKTAIRTILQINIWQYKQLIFTRITANAFLYHMVRNIMGSLLLVGNGKQDVTWLKYILQQRDRSQAGVTAKACGLYLHKVTYPQEFILPQTKNTIFDI